jgi:MraZ protein
VLLGTHKHTVDAKGRVVMPAGLRAALAEGLVVTRGFDHCLYVFPREVFSRELAGLDPRDRSNLKARDDARAVYTGASDLPLDGQGRLLVPPHLREYARLEKDVFVLGVGDHLEIWDSEAWARRQAVIESRYADTDTGRREEAT